MNRLKADRYRAKRISDFAKELHKKYDVVLATDIDEFLVLDPNTGLKLKEENIHSDYESILDNKNIDIFYIALPNSLHFEWVLKAIEKKKNILV